MYLNQIILSTRHFCSHLEISPAVELAHIVDPHFAAKDFESQDPLEVKYGNSFALTFERETNPITVK
jgi:hypothetical protein